MVLARGTYCGLHLQSPSSYRASNLSPNPLLAPQVGNESVVVVLVCLPQCGRVGQCFVQPGKKLMNAIAEVKYFPQTPSEQLEARFDAEFGVLWHFMKPKPRPVFNLQLLSELRAFHANIEQHGGLWNNDQESRISYLVLASKVPWIYNLGGDLTLFREAIILKDRQRLLDYGRNCIDNMYPWSRNLDLPLTTIGLVEGDALGGGFECALSASVLVATESARMGFPEVLFNLFPGMGAYSFLARKIGRRSAEELICGGNLYTGRQLYEMGVVDVLAPDGAGEAAVYGFIKK